VAKQNRSLGSGRLLIAVYAVFAISASARALYQLATKFTDAPLAYSLSALSAVVYIVATVNLTRSSARAKSIARLTIWFELIGVIVVGSLSFLAPDLFKHPTVWSEFGIGYGCIPLLLPILGLLWLRKNSR
jgi:Na+-driven multidrug efflux pump